MKYIDMVRPIIERYEEKLDSLNDKEMAHYLLLKQWYNNNCLCK